MSDGLDLATYVALVTGGVAVSEALSADGWPMMSPESP
jgi:hypothetical protein